MRNIEQTAFFDNDAKFQFLRQVIYVEDNNPTNMIYGNVSFYEPKVVVDGENTDLDNLESTYNLLFVHDLIYGQEITRPILFTADKIYWLWTQGPSSDGNPNRIFGWNNNLPTIEGVQENYLKRNTRLLKNSPLQEVFHKIQNAHAKRVEEDVPIIVSISKDLNRWLIKYSSTELPFEYDIYDKTNDSLTNFYMTVQEPFPKIYDLGLNGRLYKSEAIRYMGNDQREIIAYVSVPTTNITFLTSGNNDTNKELLAKKGLLPTTPLPFVVRVHGGPVARDSFGYDPYNAFFTNRGYGVLQVNYRGSSGVGSNFTQEGNGQWTDQIPADIINGVDLLVQSGVADPNRTAIIGENIGGYFTLYTLLHNPDNFACGILINGLFSPKDVALGLDVADTMKHYLPFSRSIKASLQTSNVFDALDLTSSTFINNLTKPILVIYGDKNNKRTPPAQSDDLFVALSNTDKKFKFIKFKNNDGYNIRRQISIFAMVGHIENFLHDCLGGDYEPYVTGQYDYPNSGITTGDYVCTVDTSTSPKGCDTLGWTPPIVNTTANLSITQANNNLFARDKKRIELSDKRLNYFEQLDRPFYDNPLNTFTNYLETYY